MRTNVSVRIAYLRFFIDDIVTSLVCFPYKIRLGITFLIAFLTKSRFCRKRFIPKNVTQTGLKLMQSRVNLDNALERRNNRCFQILPQNIFPNNEFVTFKLESRHVDSISRRLVNLILIYQRPSQRHALFQRNIFPCCNIVAHNMYAAKVCYPVATFNILQHISRKWPNVRNMLYETMLFSRYIQLLLAFGWALRKSSAILTLFPDVLFKIASSHIGFISAHFVRRILIIKNNSRKFGLVFQMFY